VAAEQSSARQWRRSEYDLFDLFCAVCADLLWHDPQDLIACSYSPATIRRIELIDCRARTNSLAFEAVPERGISILLDVNLVISASVSEIGPRDINLKTPYLTPARSMAPWLSRPSLPPGLRLLGQAPALGNQLATELS
jgi:hypothetical protein